MGTELAGDLVPVLQEREGQRLCTGEVMLAWEPPLVGCEGAQEARSLACGRGKYSTQEMAGSGLGWCRELRK